jgi:hypothetical protein
VYKEHAVVHPASEWGRKNGNSFDVHHVYMTNLSDPNEIFDRFFLYGLSLQLDY